MAKLFKHLKPFLWAIILIFVLLFAQAMLDLSLPGYMANIVNVGIEQDGIAMLFRRLSALPNSIKSVFF